VSKLKHKEEFEEWFLKLSRDFDANDLTIMSNAVNSGMYFYTTTKALYKQFVRIKDLENAIGEIAPWLSSSLDEKCCEGYKSACDEIFKLNKKVDYDSLFRG
jgi:hypothetical protein